MVNKIKKLSKKNRYHYDGYRQWFYAPNQEELEKSVNEYVLRIEKAHKDAAKSTLKFD